MNAAARVADRLRKRLLDLGMTQRDFGRRVKGTVEAWADQWASTVLKEPPAAIVSLDELDLVADAARITPGELVRRDDEDARFLRPSEADLVSAFQALPPPIQDYWLKLTLFLQGASVPEAAHLDEYRALTPKHRALVDHWTQTLRKQQEFEPGTTALPDPPVPVAPQTPPVPRTRGQRTK